MKGVVIFTLIFLFFSLIMLTNFYFQDQTSRWDKTTKIIGSNNVYKFFIIPKNIILNYPDKFLIFSWNFLLWRLKLFYYNKKYNSWIKVKLFEKLKESRGFILQHNWFLNLSGNCFVDWFSYSFSSWCRFIGFVWRPQKSWLLVVDYLSDSCLNIDNFYDKFVKLIKCKSIN